MKSQDKPDLTRHHYLNRKIMASVKPSGTIRAIYVTAGLHYVPEDAVFKLSEV